ncbi:dual specificity calcium/calmodulin-dependent 3',5'-cyclic nucleotide phosphodiesterase 1A-like [Tiliqua scincoides]|uniref:dual specificity calcium/calmodulin-dependent 3',5'-cyclic nucleotide phosphodiesterase 1A-like n=1 Tax=Tiliqua scincoides TaxID=71010 RepID=UPI00346182E7
MGKKGPLPGSVCLLETEDELSNIRWDSVPLSVQKWLTSTFAEEQGCKNKSEEGTHIRTISREVQASIWKEKKFRIPSSPCGLAFPEEVIAALKDVDQWSFDVFALSKASGRKSLKFMMCELFSKYNLLSQFKIPITILISFADALEVGYNRYQNSYHNSTHAADVTQTVHSFMLHTGMMHWFTDLEILALIFSASIHDYEHTGTTNYFHIQTRSEAAVLYNDKSVLENHTVSAVYKLMQNQDMNILANLTEVQWRELRQLVIMMVLATDISQHFQHMSSMRQVLHCLQQRERPDKPKVMCMILHAADMSHPSKAWELSYQWAEAVMEELFRQGDKEAELGITVSTLCDRKTTNIAECQIAFIDIIVQPAFALLLEVVEKIVAFLKNEASKSGCFYSSRASSPGSKHSGGSFQSRSPCDTTGRPCDDNRSAAAGGLTGGSLAARPRVPRSSRKRRCACAEGRLVPSEARSPGARKSAGCGSRVPLLPRPAEPRSHSAPPAQKRPRRAGPAPRRAAPDPSRGLGWQERWALRAPPPAAERRGLLPARPRSASPAWRPAGGGSGVLGNGFALSVAADRLLLLGL